ncbi:unnamed protein product [Orchesella dallaii]|uniref:DUF243 domain-containing protein n=1 Tax=Orchesella dallaii TaxID=48710 RepID=A0ABP1RI38_9HEXA
MQKSLIFMSILGVVYAGVGQLSPNEEAEAINLFNNLCSGYGSDGQDIGGSRVYCKRGSGEITESQNHRLNVQGQSGLGQTVFVQPPPARYHHNVEILSDGGPGGQTKIYVLPQEATHSITPNVQQGHVTQSKPVVYFLNGRSSSSSNSNSIRGGYGSPPSSSQQIREGYGASQVIQPVRNAPVRDNFGPPQSPPSHGGYASQQLTSTRGGYESQSTQSNRGGYASQQNLPNREGFASQLSSQFGRGLPNQSSQSEFGGFQSPSFQGTSDNFASQGPPTDRGQISITK